MRHVSALVFGPFMALGAASPAFAEAAFGESAGTSNFRF